MRTSLLLLFLAISVVQSQVYTVTTHGDGPEGASTSNGATLVTDESSAVELDVYLGSTISPATTDAGAAYYFKLQCRPPGHGQSWTQIDSGTYFTDPTTANLTVDLDTTGDVDGTLYRLRIWAMEPTHYDHIIEDMWWEVDTTA